jgi:hypothetical protein
MMFLILLALVVLLLVASVLGWTDDSRDRTNQRPADGGRVQNWPAYPD